MAVVVVDGDLGVAPVGDGQLSAIALRVGHEIRHQEDNAAPFEHLVDAVERELDVGAFVLRLKGQQFADQAQDVLAGGIAISDAALSILTAYEWPGNIRQLRNCLRSMVVMSDGPTLDVRDIPPEISQRPRLAGAAAPSAANSLAGLSLTDLEKKAIADTLAKTEEQADVGAAGDHVRCWVRIPSWWPVTA